MKKFLLTLVAAFVAFGAFAQDYPVVTSVEELASYPDNTMVLYENIEVVVQEIDYGGWVSQIPCLPDGTTQIGGNVWPIPAGFSAVGYVYTAEDWDGNQYREFYVESVVSVSKFGHLYDLLQFCNSGDYSEAVANSEKIIAAEGTAIVTSIIDDYIFFYTSLANEYGTQTANGVLKTPEAKYFNIGAELVSYDGLGGKVVPTELSRDENWNLLSYKGGHIVLDESLYIYDSTYGSYHPIQYRAMDIRDFSWGYVGEAQPVRLAAGYTIVEKDGKYYYEAVINTEEYNEATGNWEWVDKTYSVQLHSVYVDLSQYVGVCEDFIAGVYDYNNTGDEPRVLVNQMLSKTAEYNNIAEFLAKGEQYEEEIVTSFVNPLLVTYTYKDDYNYIIMVQDETGAVALDYGDVESEEEIAQLDLIKAGDMISGVKGYAQFVVANASPNIMGGLYNWTTEETTSFIPEVVSSDNAVKSAMVTTVADMLKEWADCQNNGTMPTIANKVVTVLDAVVLDTINQWDDSVKYLIQGTDTMELSNLWGAERMNFTTYERNNIVGIADYCRINSNFIYQLQPLSQEHIKDANDVPVVTSIEELKEHVGEPVIYQGAEVQYISDGYYGDYYLGDGSTYVYGFTYQGKFDLKGIYNEGEWGGNFEVTGLEGVHYFHSLSDVFNYVAAAEQAGDEVIPAQTFEAKGSAVVTYVDGENVFVQYMGTNSWGGAAMVGTLVKGVKTSVKIGDEINGLKGVATPAIAGYDEYWNAYFDRGSSFTLADDATIAVVSSDNKVQYDYTVEQPGYIEYNASTYSGMPLRMGPGGEIVKEGEKFYYVATDAKDGTQTQIECASNVVDLNTYVGTPFDETTLVLGVLDAKNSSEDAMVFLVTGTTSTLLNYNNIAEMIAAGPQTDSSMTSVLVNPVTVTYKHIEIGEWSNTLYLVVEDETGALGIQLQDLATMDLVEVGTQIQNVKGIVSQSWMGYYWLQGYDQENWGLDLAFDVVGTAEVVPTDVTIAELVADEATAEATGSAYAWRLVSLKDVAVGRVVTIQKDENDEDVEVESLYLVQGTDSLSVPKALNEMFVGIEKMDLKGIVDIGVLNYNQYYTVLPRSAEDINDITALNNVVVEGGIYLNDANQVVAAGAEKVEVYDLNGRKVVEAKAATVDAEGLASGVYVVRATYADGVVKAAKVVR